MKIVMTGDVGVGKTSILMSLKGEEYVHTRSPTIGVDFVKYKDANIWDTAGQEVFHSITNSYYRGADAIVIVYSDQESFENISKWYDDIKQVNTKGKLYIFRNKCDQLKTVIPLESLTLDHDGHFVVSAQNNIGIAEGFYAIMYACEVLNTTNLVPLKKQIKKFQCF